MSLIPHFSGTWSSSCYRKLVNKGEVKKRKSKFKEYRNSRGDLKILFLEVIWNLRGTGTPLSNESQDNSLWAICNILQDFEEQFKKGHLQSKFLICILISATQFRSKFPLQSPFHPPVNIRKPLVFYVFKWERKKRTITIFCLDSKSEECAIYEDYHHDQK